MARNRMIKPEFWSDEKTGMIMSSDEKCLYIGMWNFSDDEGLINGNAIYLKSSIFPYNNTITPEKIEEFLEKFTEIEVIFKYKKNNQPYIWIINFKKHQRIDRPGKPQNPSPSIQNSNYHMAIFRRDNFICHICGEYTDISDDINICNSKAPSIDHVIPKSKGGLDYPSNLKTACISCNKSKKDNPILRTFDDHSTTAREQGKGKERKGKGKEGKIFDDRSTIDHGTIDKHSAKDTGHSLPFFDLNYDDDYELKDLCQHLESKNIFPEVVSFTTEMITQRGINPKTMVHVLEKAKKKKKFDDTRGGVKAYCQKIIVMEDPNFNEKDHIERHDNIKKKTSINPKVRKKIANIGGKK